MAQIMSHWSRKWFSKKEIIIIIMIVVTSRQLTRLIQISILMIGLFMEVCLR